MLVVDLECPGRSGTPISRSSARAQAQILNPSQALSDISRNDNQREGLDLRFRLSPKP